MKFRYLLLTTAIAFGLWGARANQKEEVMHVGHPVRVYARDIETEVFGVDYNTEFTPGVKTGGLVLNNTELPNISPEDDLYEAMDMLARCVEAEAGNQGIEGKRLVVDVILNRVRDEDFPDTIEEVISQPYQFSVYWNGSIDKVDATEETWKVIRQEMLEVSYPDVFYFTSEGFHIYGTPWKKIGDHYFNKK